MTMLTMTAGAVDSAEAETLLVKYVETHNKMYGMLIEGRNRARAQLVGTQVGFVVTMSAYFGAWYFLEGGAMVAVAVSAVLLTLWWYSGSVKEWKKHEQAMCECDALEKTRYRIQGEFSSLTGVDIFEVLKVRAERYEVGKLKLRGDPPQRGTRLKRT
jgi:hypothetical protein